MSRVPHEGVFFFNIFVSIKIGEKVVNICQERTRDVLRCHRLQRERRTDKVAMKTVVTGRGHDLGVGDICCQR